MTSQVGGPVGVRMATGCRRCRANNWARVEASAGPESFCLECGFRERAPTVASHITHTRTAAVLEVPPDMFELVARQLRAAGYDHVFGMSDGKPMIDMHGIALQAEEQVP